MPEDDSFANEEWFADNVFEFDAIRN